MYVELVRVDSYSRDELEKKLVEKYGEPALKYDGWTILKRENFEAARYLVEGGEVGDTWEVRFPGGRFVYLNLSDGVAEIVASDRKLASEFKKLVTD